MYPQRKTALITLIALTVLLFTCGIAYADNGATPEIDFDQGTIETGTTSGDDLEAKVTKVWNYIMVGVAFVVAWNIISNALALGSKNSSKRAEGGEGLAKSVIGAVIAFGVWKIVGWAMGVLG
ncbi:MAG: hypothetical protein FH756_00210 [Firmicutes bacterium]|nr:hypothetical protein [Bacillota bacterium]